MKIIIEDIEPDEEEAVIIRCREVDEAVMQLVNGLKLKKEKLTVLHLLPTLYTEFVLQKRHILS